MNSIPSGHPICSEVVSLETDRPGDDDDDGDLKSWCIQEVYRRTLGADKEKGREEKDKVEGGIEQLGGFSQATIQVTHIMLDVNISVFVYLIVAYRLYRSLSWCCRTNTCSPKPLMWHLDPIISVSLTLPWNLNFSATGIHHLERTGNLPEVLLSSYCLMNLQLAYRIQAAQRLQK